MTRPSLLLALLCLLLPACEEGPDPDDADEDGYPDGQDCDPQDRSVHPGAEDPWGDGRDQDCDGTDGVDGDHDGFAGNARHEQRDCDDGDAEVHPEAADSWGDGIDQDCDGLDGVDADGDEHASQASGGDDCDDGDLWTHPGATDYEGDGADEDCDGVDGRDADGDGFASEKTLGDDCDDADATVYPGADEACDGIDSDCAFTAAEVDDDQDGWLVCAGDCDDGDAAAYPGAPEPCDGVDHDCDGVLPTIDGDGDGYAGCQGDCAPADPSIHPGATEVCDGVDDDCDGQVPAEELDGDGDGWSGCRGDCDDGDAEAFPGQWFETPSDGVDSDCDGQDAQRLLSGASRAFQESSARNVFGGTVAAAGDVDGDGLADLLVVAPGSNSTGAGAYTAGRTAVYLGARLGSAPAGPLDLWDAWAVLEGEGGLDFSGTSAAGLGDVDGDGLGDLLVGAFGNDDAGSNAGKVYLVLGADLAGGGVFDLGTAATWLWTGEQQGDELGISVAAAGDLDADGLMDLAFGAHQGSGYEGRVYVVLAAALGVPGTRPASSAGRMLTGVAPGDFSGTSLDGGHDFDGDGLDDLLVGAPSADGGGYGSGCAYLVCGARLASPVNLDLGSADLTIEGTTNNQQAGEVVRFVDDLDGDGRPELAVGALVGTPALRVMLSGSLPTKGTVPLSQADHVFPGAVPGPSDADVDGDGVADLLLGYPELGAAGGVRVFLGAGLAAGQHAESSADFAWAGTTAGDAAGWGMAGAGDVDGDGLDDVLAGSHRPGDSTVSGKAWLLLSPF